MPTSAPKQRHGVSFDGYQLFAATHVFGLHALNVKS